jgi:FKBP-type peptidyl-prolyl cis-trans isomerase FklB
VLREDYSAKQYMKKLTLSAVVAMGLFAAMAHAQELKLQSQTDRVSYSIGLNIGNSLKQQQGLELNSEAVLTGVRHALTGGKTLLTEQEVREAMMALQKEMIAKQANVAEKNKKEGQAFLEANKKKPGVKALPSGLQYEVLTEGKGPKPGPADTVRANYKGTLIDGTEFDSSEKQGGPAVFPLNGVIKGWTEALQLMSVGSKWRIFIPSHLAYGEQGAGGIIGPNATLIFEVELVGIES